MKAQATTTYTSPGDELVLESSREADGALLRRAQAGERAAQSELYRRYASTVARWVRSRTRRDVEDVVQDVFVAVFTTGREFRADASVETYLATVAYRRASRRSPGHEQLVELDDGAGDPPLEVTSSQHDPILARRIRDAYDELDPNLREVLALIVLQHRSSREAAAAIGVPVGTVKSRLASAKAALRSRLRRLGVPSDVAISSIRSRGSTL